MEENGKKTIENKKKKQVRNEMRKSNKTSIAECVLKMENLFPNESRPQSDQKHNHNTRPLTQKNSNSIIVVSADIFTPMKNTL